MTILVLSDSHGNCTALQKAVDLAGNVDAIIHLGDGYRQMAHLRLPDVPVYFVLGNGEDMQMMRRDDVKRELLVDFEGIKILMMHGHTHNVKFGVDRALMHAAELEADVLLFGHTHQPYHKKHRVFDKEIDVFNPGSVGEPKFGSVGSFGIVTIRDGQLLFSWGEVDAC